MGVRDVERQELGKRLSVGAPDSAAPEVAVSLLTGGADRPYVLGLAPALMAEVTLLDLIGSDDLDSQQFHGRPEVRFLNLRGSQKEASFVQKAFRVSAYYVKLILYAATAKPRIFHILWNNKFELFDRTVLMLYYRLLRKRVVVTVHNVNAGRRDAKDSWINRLTLRIQYRLAHHLLVHTEKMKTELVAEFGVPGERVTVIPFGINNAVPNTSLTPAGAKQRLGIRDDQKTILFFGNITPYKGLEYLIAAFRQLQARYGNYHLIIAGKPDHCEQYWKVIRDDIQENVQTGQVLLKAEFVADSETEVYFKAADLLVLPYKHVYQSGVLFLGYSFGLPVVAADVGSLKDEIVEGETGFVFIPEDAADLARAIEEHFASETYANLNGRRQGIRDYATERHSWDVVGGIIMSVYANLLRVPFACNRDVAGTSFEVKAPS